MKKLSCIYILFLILISTTLIFGKEKSNTIEETRQLLSKKSVFNLDSNLPKLFEIGDKRINDLITILDDSDRKVSINAQLVIRFLGNPDGTKKLYLWFRKQAAENKPVYLAGGAIPIPINQWEFDYFEESLRKKKESWSYGLNALFFPLLLDESETSKSFLEKTKSDFDKITNSVGWNLWNKKLKFSNKPQLPLKFNINSDFAKSVLDNAFFLNESPSNSLGFPIDVRRAKFLAFNSKKDKALLFLSDIDSPWHIVIQKNGEDWKFFSITRTGIY